MQSLIGFVNFYGNNIFETTEHTAPLFDLIAARNGNESLKLTAEHLESFEEIKRRLCTSLRLAHPYFEKPFILYRDASLIAFGAVLLQRDNSGVERAISLFSKILSIA